MTRKTTKNYGFWMVFWSFWVLGPILAHQTAKFELNGQFCFSRHPWGPWGRLSIGLKPKSADSVTVYTLPIKPKRNAEMAIISKSLITGHAIPVVLFLLPLTKDYYICSSPCFNSRVYSKTLCLHGFRRPCVEATGSDFWKTSNSLTRSIESRL